MNTSTVLASQAHYLRMGVVQISLANFLILAMMVVALVLALVIPFPHGHEESEGASDVQH